MPSNALTQENALSEQSVNTPVAKIVVEKCTLAWPLDRVEALFDLPFNDLMFQAQQVHREHFNANELQLSSLLSIKTGACPEDCKYCPQSARYKTGLEAERLMRVEAIVDAAKRAKANGAGRFCWARHGEAQKTKI